ncbi:hypothetical protein B0A57_04275 [Flavobacterium psychrophilum DSM 3660 = ATCC 49418]|nr:hypothetical protein B0A57_04275 [Flavobacterium psychrophilum DSM 3660 = ATCC 49418]
MLVVNASFYKNFILLKLIIWVLLQGLVLYCKRSSLSFNKDKRMVKYLTQNAVINNVRSDYFTGIL